MYMYNPNQGASFSNSGISDMGAGASTTTLQERVDEQQDKVEEKKRYNTLRPSPPNAKFKLAVVQFKVPGAKNGGSDKGPDGNRVDSIPIANSVIKAGGACDLILFDSE
eukprot:jgi/Chrpa1/12284/Chrysochromulina_OHIO_Genome00019153-RA